MLHIIEKKVADYMIGSLDEEGPIHHVENKATRGAWQNKHKILRNHKRGLDDQGKGTMKKKNM